VPYNANQTANPPPGTVTTPSQEIAQNLYGQVAPTVAQSGVSMADLMQQIGLTVPGLNVQMAGGELGLQLGEEQLGVSQEQNQLSQSDVAAQEALLGTESGLEQQEYGLQSQQYPEQLAEAAQQYATNKSTMQSSQAGSGTMNTAGAGQAQSNLTQQYGWQQADINRNQQLAALGQQGTVAQQKYDASALARQEQNLQLAAQANGISVQQLIQQWQSGMFQLGEQADPTSLYTQYLSQEGQGVSALGGVLSQGALLGGLGGIGTLFGGSG
jgi:hypothetical protein